MRIGLVLAATLAVVAFPALSASKLSVPTKMPAAEVVAKATGLEETYARLCTGATAATNDEACVALKLAMIAKLTGTKPAVAAATPVAAPQQQTTGGLGGALVGLLTRVTGVAQAPANGATVVGVGHDRTITAPYGQTTKLEMKIVKAQMVEVLVEANEGTASAQVCLAAGFWGGDGYCLGPTELSKQSALYRLRAPRNGEFQVKLKTKGPASANYTVRTRAVTGGDGAVALAEFAKLAGRPYFGVGSIEGLPVKVAVTYAVEQPGRSGVFTFRDEAGKTDYMRVAVDAAGDAAFAMESTRETGRVAPGIDGLISIHLAAGRAAYGVDAQGRWVNEWWPKKDTDIDKAGDAGGFQRERGVVVAATTEREVAAMRKAGPARIAAAKAKRFMQWGALNALAGKTWGVTGQNSAERIVSYVWEQPQQVLVAHYWSPPNLGLAPDSTGRLAHYPQNGAVTGTVTSGTGVTGISYRMEADGRMVASQGAWSWTLTTDDSGDVIEDYLKTGNGQPVAQRRYRQISPQRIAELTQQAQSYRQQQLAAAQQAQQDSGGSDLFNTLNAIRSAGSIDGAFKQGMVQMLNQKAPGLGDIYGAAATPGGLKGAAGGVSGSVNPLTGMRTGGGSSGAGGGPNLAVGSHCPGFTEGNYRSHAFNGGGDQQLYALCGQAFEYYHMYQNAVQQGDPDAGRTYQAHSDAVRQIKQFRAEAR